jgi:preprotein translocase subunit YajC
VLISSAYAQAAGAADATGSMMQFLPIILMFGVLWFLMIRPQQKRAKEHKAMLDALSKGDEIVTGGGIAGRVVKVGENFVAVELATGVEVQVQKPAISLVLPKGTLKAL